MIFRLTADASGTGSYFLVLIAMFAVMYFIMIRPQRKQQKEQAARLSALEIGDSVRTSSGFFGTVIDIDDSGNTVIVEFGNNKNCRIPMMKEAIVEVEKPESAVKPIETAETKQETKKKGLFGFGSKDKDGADDTKETKKEQ